MPLVRRGVSIGILANELHSEIPSAGELHFRNLAIEKAPRFCCLCICTTPASVSAVKRAGH